MNPTDRHSLLDRESRPYFLWDLDMDLESFRRTLGGADLNVRAYFAAKLMRQAKPDDVFQFLSLREIGELWPEIKGYLGRTRPFWTWLLTEWEALPGEER